MIPAGTYPTDGFGSTCTKEKKKWINEKEEMNEWEWMNKKKEFNLLRKQKVFIHKKLLPPPSTQKFEQLETEVYCHGLT